MKPPCYAQRGDRFVLLLTERRDYFFYLYVVGVAGQLWLTLLALLHYPDAQHLEPVPGSDEAAYEVRLCVSA